MIDEHIEGIRLPPPFDFERVLENILFSIGVHIIISRMLSGQVRLILMILVTRSSR